MGSASFTLYPIVTISLVAQLVKQDSPRHPQASALIYTDEFN
jgi:hypothetical protein